MTNPISLPDSVRAVLRDPRLPFDAALAAGLAALAILPKLNEMSGMGFLAMVIATVPVALRRLRPGSALAATALGSCAVLVFDSSLGPVILVAPVMVYSMARWASPALANTALLAGLVGSVLGPLVWFGFSYSLDLSITIVGMLACGSIVGGAYLLGRRRSESLDAQQQQQQAAVERERLVVAEQEQRTYSTAVSERQRIARELHDIVAHSLSVIVVQAEGGKALTAKHPERAPEVLGTIADASREALAEMRRMVGLLRNEDDAGADLKPAPGLFDLPELVERSQTDATLEVHGAVPAVSPTLGLAVYRIVQESLTNVLKHAGSGARATVVIDYLPTAIRLQISDDGRGFARLDDESPQPGHDLGGGHGLQGMADRVALHGGTLTAAPRSGAPGGFVVRVQLPLREDR